MFVFADTNLLSVKKRNTVKSLFVRNKPIATENVFK